MKRRKDKIVEDSMLMNEKKNENENENENEKSFFKNKKIILNMAEDEMTETIYNSKKDGKEMKKLIFDSNKLNYEKEEKNNLRVGDSDGNHKIEKYEKTENGEEIEKERIKNVALIIEKKIFENEQSRNIKELKDKEKLNFENRILSLQAQVENQSKSVCELRELTASLREGTYIHFMLDWLFILLLPSQIFKLSTFFCFFFTFFHCLRIYFIF